MKENQKEINSLEKKFKIKIPHNIVSNKMEEDFLQLSKTLKVAGFRPGKVPISFVKSKYLNQVLTNVSEKLIREEGNKKFDKEGYKIASQPKVTLLSEFKENSDLEAEFSFEILPEIKLNDFKKLELENFSSKIEDKEVEKVIKKLFFDYRNFDKLKNERKSKKEDRIIISFKGYINNELFEGGSAQNQTFDIGNNNYLPEFEKELIGKDTNKEVVINLTFPDNYQKKDLQGKKAKFNVIINEILEPKVLTSEEELAKKVGVKDKKELRNKIKTELERYSKDLSFSILKNNIINKIESEYEFLLPTSLVEKEYNLILGSMQDLEKKNDKEKDKILKSIRNQANKKVKIGLIISEIGIKNKIIVTDQEIQNEIAKICVQYPGKEKEIIEFYKKNPDRMNSLKGPVFEDKVIKYIINNAKVKQIEISSDDLNKKINKIEEEVSKNKQWGKKWYHLNNMQVP